MRRKVTIVAVVLVLAGAGAAFVYFFLPSVDLDGAEHFGSDMIRLGYPGDWMIDESHPEHDPMSCIAIAGDRGTMTVRLFESVDDAQSLVMTGVGRWPDGVAAAGEARPLGSVGRFDGYGVEMKISGGVGGRLVRLFVAEVSPGYRLEIAEDFPALTTARLEPGLDLVRNTLNVYPPDGEQRRSAPRNPPQ